jgi:hypothetical protein
MPVASRAAGWGGIMPPKGVCLLGNQYRRPESDRVVSSYKSLCICFVMDKQLTSLIISVKLRQVKHLSWTKQRNVVI